MSVLSLANAKTHLNVTTTKDDGEIQALIDAAEAAIAQRVGPLKPTTVTARVSGSTALVLPVCPVLSLSTVVDDAGTAVTLGDLSVDLDAGVVTYLTGARFPTYFTVVYQAGRNPCPADILLAVKELVRHLWMTQRNPALFPGSSISDGPASVPGAAYLMPYRVQELIAPHEQFGFA